MKTYDELLKLRTFEDRFNYLKLKGNVGEETFGFDRIFNQKFYRSSEWKHIRHQIIVRDNGCDLGIPGYDIYDEKYIVIHHMNPVSLDDIKNNIDILLDPRYLISVSRKTHNLLHYGSDYAEEHLPISRSPNDMCPWKT